MNDTTTTVPTDWWSALGHPLPPEGIDAAYRLSVAEGLPAGEAEIVLNIVRREIEHDNPERAFATVRHWLEDHSGDGNRWNETFVMRLLATICTGGG